MYMTDRRDTMREFEQVSMIKNKVRKRIAKAEMKEIERQKRKKKIRSLKYDYSKLEFK